MRKAMEKVKRMAEGVRMKVRVAVLAVMVLAGMVAPVMANAMLAQPVGATIGWMIAEVDAEAGVMKSISVNDTPETSILDPNMDIEGILKLALKILVYGLGVAATAGVVIAGVMYMTARDSEQQVATAKKRLIEIAIGLAAWAVMFALLNWLIPGGMSF